MNIRSSENEKLDDLTLHGEPLHKALQSLEWVNRWFGNHRSVVKAILRVTGKEKKTWHIIDLGCGGGDLALAVAKSLSRHKIECTITGIDGNANTLAYAEKKCAAFNEISFLQADILDNQFTIQPCDILISSHFIYHFSADVLVDFLRNNLPAVSTAIIFSELKRNRFAMRLFKFCSFLLPISKLAKEDGLLAIKRSFSEKEWLAILQQAGIGTYSLQSVPLFRILLTSYPARKI
ncbi:MAG: methyltransferase domain-containing protein [Chitinophagaceae bacterium]|nr:methyltransferase domain-containing protein [Chitinophagaceae bacterium]